MSRALASAAVGHLMCCLSLRPLTPLCSISCSLLTVFPRKYTLEYDFRFISLDFFDSCIWQERGSGRGGGVGGREGGKRINLQTLKCWWPTLTVLLADYLQIRIIYKSLFGRNGWEKCQHSHWWIISEVDYSAKSTQQYQMEKCFVKVTSVLFPLCFLANPVGLS